MKIYYYVVVFLDVITFSVFQDISMWWRNLWTSRLWRTSWTGIDLLHIDQSCGREAGDLLPLRYIFPPSLLFTAVYAIADWKFLFNLCMSSSVNIVVSRSYQSFDQQGTKLSVDIPVSYPCLYSWECLVQCLISLWLQE